MTHRDAAGDAKGESQMAAWDPALAAPSLPGEATDDAAGRSAKPDQQGAPASFACWQLPVVGNCPLLYKL